MSKSFLINDKQIIKFNVNNNNFDNLKKELYKTDFYRKLGCILIQLLMIGKKKKHVF